MPELPDVTVYLERLAAYVLDRTIWRAQVLNPFVLRTVEPPIGEASGKRVTSLAQPCSANRPARDSVYRVGFN